MAQVAERGLCVGLVQQPRFVWGEGSQHQTVPAAPRAKPAQAERRPTARHNYQMPGQAGHDERVKPGMTKDGAPR